jgi:hypothetical protein
MATTSERMQKRSFEAPDETRPAGRAEAAVVTIHGLTFARITGLPGWRWATDVKPIAQSDSCQAVHTGLVLTGRLHVMMDDGAEEEFGPGDLYHLPAGHDAWVVGDEPYACVDVTGSFEWAKPR